MSKLTAYVDRKNAFGKLFNSKYKQLSIQNADDRKSIAQSLDSELSPENLTCDGELSASQVRTKYTALMGAAKELIALDPSVQNYMYEFA
jgi:hypothetical protein